MRPTLRMTNSVLLAAGLASAMLLGGCYTHHHYREDTYTVQWTANEEPRYEQWERDTRRDHRDWDRRNADEQHDYWEWRKHHS